MSRKFMVLAFGFLWLALAADRVHAQGSQCAQRAQVLQHLSEKYGETRRSVGLAANSAVVEVFASAESGSWTITVTSPAGLTCLVASGMGFEAVTEELPAKGEPA